MDIHAAIAFVSANASPVEQARLKYLLGGERPAEEAVRQLFDGQRADGGWAPFWAADYSSLDATCFRLAQAEQAGLGSSERGIARAIRFLANRQLPGGSWEEDRDAAASAPSWARPGETAARLYLTANCGFWLAHYRADPYGAGRAAAYLQRQLDAAGHLPTFLHAHWLAAGLWTILEWKDLAGQVFAYLEQCLGELPPSSLAWLVVTLRIAGLPAAHPLLEQAANLLEAGQAADGRWASQDGPERDVHTTLEALRALNLCGRFPINS